MQCELASYFINLTPAGAVWGEEPQRGNPSIRDAYDKTVGHFLDECVMRAVYLTGVTRPCEGDPELCNRANLPSPEEQALESSTPPWPLL